MAQATGKAKSDAGKLSCINIEVVGNGITLRERFVPKADKKGLMMYEPDKPSDAMAFSNYDEAMKYIGDCLKPCFSGYSEKSEKMA